LLRVQVLSLAYFALQLFAGLSMFRMFVIVHECGHGSLFRNSKMNALFGLWASVFCLVPFTPWRNIHRLHHRWVGVIDKDPTQAALLRLKGYSAGMNFLFRLVWKLWIPAMYLVFIFNVFWGYPFRELFAKKYRNALAGFGSLLVCAAPRALMLAYDAKLALILLAPMLYVFLFVDENVSLPQHTGLFPYLSDTHPKPIAFYEQDAVTRTTHEPGWLGVLLAYNFNLHTEHHLLPSVPWYWLPKVSARIARLETYQQVNFLEYMLEIRGRDPVDVYTRALPGPSTTPPDPQRREERVEVGREPAE
jgi:fatty acid desaturase